MCATGEYKYIDSKPIELNKIEGKIPFIYGKSQEIDVSLGQNKIELNLKFSRKGIKIRWNGDL